MTKGLVIAAVAVVAVALFLVGMLARRFGSSPPRQRVQAGSPAAAPKTPPPPNPIADLQFVVSTDSNGQTVTTTMAPNMTDTAPAGTGATSTAGGDATAMPAEQYGRISQAPPAAPTTTSPMKPVDPRTIPGDVVAPPRPAPVPKPRTEKPAEERTARAERTSPVPISQPLPNIDHERLREDVSLRFDLTVGADGRVKEIQVLRSGGGLTGAMIESIQKWRFKPGTLDGEPVESHFTVDVSFQAR